MSPAGLVRLVALETVLLCVLSWALLGAAVAAVLRGVAP